MTRLPRGPVRGRRVDPPSCHNSHRARKAYETATIHRQLIRSCFDMHAGSVRRGLAISGRVFSSAESLRKPRSSCVANQVASVFNFHCGSPAYLHASQSLEVLRRQSDHRVAIFGRSATRSNLHLSASPTRSSHRDPGRLIMSHRQ